MSENELCVKKPSVTMIEGDEKTNQTKIGVRGVI
jgi:hypothetical protein